MSWKTKKLIKQIPKLKNPVLIEGLPGIGNVGKITLDFMIDELKPKKIMEFSSYNMPHSVFVNEKNLVELPKLELYMLQRSAKNAKLNDVLFLTGDVQPTTEEACYSFCETFLGVIKELGVKEMLTLGGIGLMEIPKIPRVYCTGNNAELIKKYKDDTKMISKIYGVVGPIVGVTGVLTGMAEDYDIGAVCLLAEAIGHPMFLGMSSAREVIKVIDQKLALKLNLVKLDKDIKELEADMQKQAEAQIAGDSSETPKKLKPGQPGFNDANYIG